MSKKHIKQSEQNGITVSFFEKNHSYYDQIGRRYESVTKFISKFFEPFDSDLVALRIATRDGVSKETILEQWEREKMEACELGTRTHELCEAIMTNSIKLPKPETERQKRAFKLAWDACQMLRAKWSPFLSEFIVFDSDWKLAGTVDQIMVENPAKVPGKIWILDWKTNKKITTANYGRYAKKPISHVPDCNFAKYTIQLRLYEAMIKKNKIFGDAETDCAIIHLQPNSDRPEFIHVPRIDDVIMAMISGARGRVEKSS